MYCTNCGRENAEGTAFCECCGMPMTPPVSSTKKKSGMAALLSNKYVLIGGGAGILLLIILIIVIAALIPGGSQGSNFVIDKPSLMWMAYETSDDEALLWEGKNMYRGVDIANVQQVNDGEVVVFRDDEELICLVDGEKKVLTDNYRSVMVSFYGDYIYYIDEDETFTQYRVAKDSKKNIAWEGKSVAVTAMSANGEYVAYLVSYDSYGDDVETFLYHDGVSVEIDVKNFIPCSISDNGKLLYGFTYDQEDEEYTLVAVKNGEKSKLSSASSKILDVEVNYDGTQILFQSNGNTYLSVNGQEKVKLCSYEVSAVQPSYSVAVKDFRECLFYGNNTLLSYDFDEEEGNTIRNVSNVKINDAGDTVYYLKNSILYTVPVSDFEEPTVLSTDLVSSYAFTQDGSYVYYINSEDELIARRPGKTKEERIADDADEVRVTDSGEVFVLTEYYRNMGELRYGKGTELEKICSDVYKLYVQGDEVVYSLNYDSNDGSFDVYYRTSGSKFDRIGEMVQGFGFRS